MTRLHALPCLLLCAGLGGCALLRPVPPPAPPAPVRLPPAAAAVPMVPLAALAFEQQQSALATDLLLRGELADAAVAWEVLCLLQPASPLYRERLAHTRALVAAAVAEQWPRALQAQRRADWASAEQLYLAVLSVQPDHAAAAQALRALEHERALRGASARRAVPPPARAEAMSVHPRLRR